jgi:isoleucyl-tRNA synthetase
MNQRFVPHAAAPTKSETAKREEDVLAFWRADKTFEKSIEKTASSGEFVFYDGPPFATGLPHHGSLLSSIVKDVVPRYKTMRGFRVRRRWGWDCHGLPIESLVEKELGLKTKKDIVDVGIKAFNEKARSMVLQYVHDWERYVERIGRWVDFKNSYKTMDNTFIESVWWALKRLVEKKLLYEGKKVLMYCPHCETPLAKAEIAMDNTYKDVTEEAVTVRFRVARPAQYGLPDRTSILAWTTTPWTLPGNVALAVNPDVDYVLVPEEGGMVLIAADRLDIWRGSTRPKVMVDMGKSYKGRDLVGVEYEPLYDVAAVMNHTGKRHVVLPADFVTTTEGTGIVHTAVMYGEDDYVLGVKEGLPQVQLLEPNGTYNASAPEMLRGVYIKDAEKIIKQDLQSRGLLFDRKNNTHSYPHCYRCGTPLIYNAVASWFIDIQKVKTRMLEENQKVQWVPAHLRDGRFKNIVAGAPDWTISRNRFWASPLPVWKEKNGECVKIIGSLEELRSSVKRSGNRYFVMRHGEAENNASGVVSRDAAHAFGLTDAGRAQSRKAAAKLRGIEGLRIYSSPVRRATETASAVAQELGIDPSHVITDSRLSELDFGELEGKGIDAFMAACTHLGGIDTKLPGGESYLEAKQRFGAFMRELEERSSGETILIVTHGIGCESLFAIAEGADAVASWQLINERPFGYAFLAELPYVPLPLNDRYELDLHRPYIDSIVLKDEEGRLYERIPEVVDCWVESGSMPFAEHHYPFGDKSAFEKRAPGDFIAEYIAQTRTWFYYMHAMGVLLFDRLAFKTVVSTGTILAENGEKISKSKRNYTDPLELIDRYGSDALRFYLMSSPVMQAEDVRFRDDDVRDAHNRVIGILWNAFKFYELHAKDYDGSTRGRKSRHLLDRWVYARLDEATRQVTAAFDAYDTPSACRAIRSFVDDYSTWYVRRSRERMKGNDVQYALATQRDALTVVSQLIAPVMPFLAESIWRGLGRKESIHLSSWPAVPHSLWKRLFGPNDAQTLAAMHETRVLVSRALEARDKAGLKVRQPLAKLELRETKLSKAHLAIIAEEVNVKEVVRAAIADELKLDTTLTDELRAEGFVREALRAIQAARKAEGLKPGELSSAEVRISSPAMLAAVHAAETEIKTAASLADIRLTLAKDGGKEIEVVFFRHVR